MSKRIVGVSVIIIGVLLLLSNFGYFAIENIWAYMWPIILILIAVVGFIERKSYDFLFSTLIFIGMLYLLKTLNIIGANFINLVLFPFIIVNIGANLLVSFKVKPIAKDTSKYFAFFSGIEELINDNKYKGSELTAIFGGIDIDLKLSKFESKTININARSVFGGITIVVPENVKVITKGVPFFGACENKTKIQEKQEYTIVINYSVIFGGIEIKN